MQQSVGYTASEAVSRYSRTDNRESDSYYSSDADSSYQTQSRFGQSSGQQSKLIRKKADNSDEDIDTFIDDEEDDDSRPSYSMQSSSQYTQGFRNSFSSYNDSNVSQSVTT